jgi:hypothetical protein
LEVAGTFKNAWLLGLFPEIPLIGVKVTEFSCEERLFPRGAPRTRELLDEKELNYCNYYRGTC